jgi:hypothetical protein
LIKKISIAMTVIFTLIFAAGCSFQKDEVDLACAEWKDVNPDTTRATFAELARNHPEFLGYLSKVGKILDFERTYYQYLMSSGQFRSANSQRLGSDSVQKNPSTSAAKKIEIQLIARLPEPSNPMPLWTDVIEYKELVDEINLLCFE